MDLTDWPTARQQVERAYNLGIAAGTLPDSPRNPNLQEGEVLLLHVRPQGNVLTELWKRVPRRASDRPGVVLSNLRFRCKRVRRRAVWVAFNPGYDRVETPEELWGCKDVIPQT